MSIESPEIVAYPLSDASTLPKIRPAALVRNWQRQTTESFAALCLPMNIANNNGWELELPGGFDAVYHGGEATRVLEIYPHGDGPCIAESHFGYGVLTFHLHYLFRTPEGVHLQIYGPVNLIRDGIQALSGLLETDWSPYASTMNWRFTRPGRVRFNKGEAFAHISPAPARYVNSFQTRIGDLHSEHPDVEADMALWAKNRNDLLQKIKYGEPGTSKTEWHKLYYRGFYPDGDRRHCAHATRLEPKPFSDPQSLTAHSEHQGRAGTGLPVTGVIHTEHVDWTLFRLLDDLSGRVDQIIVLYSTHQVNADTLRQIPYVNVELLPMDDATNAVPMVIDKARHDALIILAPGYVLLDSFWTKMPDYLQRLQSGYSRIVLNVHRSTQNHATRALLQAALETSEAAIAPVGHAEAVVVSKPLLTNQVATADYLCEEKLIVDSAIPNNATSTP